VEREGRGARDLDVECGIWMPRDFGLIKPYFIIKNLLGGPGYGMVYIYIYNIAVLFII
jgi:hypothetical protein